MEREKGREPLPGQQIKEGLPYSASSRSRSVGRGGGGGGGRSRQRQGREGKARQGKGKARQHTRSCLFPGRRASAANIHHYFSIFSRTRTSSRSRCHPTSPTYAPSLLPYCAPASQLLDRRASREEEHTLAAGSQPKSFSAPQAAADM